MEDRNENPVYEGERLTPRASVSAYLRWVNNGESTKSGSKGVFGLYDFTYSPIDDEPTTLLKGIRFRCLECAGSAEAVRTCTAYKPFLDIPPCPLWLHRFGKRHVTEEYREARRSQANKQRREPGTGGTFAPQEPAQD